MKIQNLGKTRINVKSGDDRHKLYVTKYSTCDDIMHSIISKLHGSDMKRHSLAVFEQSMGVERMLSGGTRVLKIVRSWGCESSNFELAVKMKPSLLELRKEFRHLGGNAELAIDDIYKKHFRHKNYVDKNLDLTDDDYLSRGQETPKLVTKKTSESCYHSNSNDTISGKQAILSRYISDVFTLKSRRSKGLGQRSNGDGTAIPVAQTSHDPTNSLSHYGLLDVCKKSWELQTETYNESDDESLHDSTGVNDLECPFDNISDTDEGVSELDMAFVNSTWDCDSDEGIDATSINSGDLNTAFVGDVQIRFESYNRGNSSAFEISYGGESSVMSTECLSCCSLNMDNTRKMNLVKNVFERDNIESEDDEMDSFMVSRVEIC